MCGLDGISVLRVFDVVIGAATNRSTAKEGHKLVGQ